MKEKQQSVLEEEEKQIVIEIRRVTKVTKGGKNLNFRAIVVVGNGKGECGYGVGKAGEVPEAIRKGVESARRSLIEIPLSGTTIPHDVRAKSGASRVILKPAVKGHGMVAGRTMRALFEVAGIKDITSKCIGSTNALNVLSATIKALSMLKKKKEEENETE